MMPVEIHSFQPEEIMAFLDGELPAVQAHAAAQHIAECSECRQLAADLRNLSANFSDWHIPPASYVAPTAIRDEAAITGTPFWRRPWLLAAAAALVIACGSFFFKTSSSVQITPAPALEALRDAPAPVRLFKAEGMAAENKQFDKSQATQSLPFSRDAASASGPFVVRTARLAITTGRFNSCRSDVEEIAVRNHGYISQLEIAAPANAGRSLNAALKIPAAQLDATMQALRLLGDVRNENQNAADVTRSYVDNKARLANLEASETRLQQILRDRTGKLSDVLEVEQALDRTRGDINVLEAEQRNLSTQIEYAAVEVTVSEDYKVPAFSPTGERSKLTALHNAAIAGYRNAIDGAVSVLVFLLSIGPGLLLIMAIAIWPVRRWWRIRSGSAPVRLK